MVERGGRASFGARLCAGSGMVQRLFQPPSALCFSVNSPISALGHRPSRATSQQATRPAIGCFSSVQGRRMQPLLPTLLPFPATWHCRGKSQSVWLHQCRPSLAGENVPISSLPWAGLSSALTTGLFANVIEYVARNQLITACLP